MQDYNPHILTITPQKCLESPISPRKRKINGISSSENPAYKESAFYILKRLAAHFRIISSFSIYVCGSHSRGWTFGMSRPLNPSPILCQGR